MKSILITGAAGFIGTALRRFWKDTYHVIGIDRREYKAIGMNEDVHIFDLCDTISLSEFAKTHFKNFEYAGVIHLAAYYDFTNRNHPEYENLQEAWSHLLNLVREYLAHDVPIVFSSSMAALAPTIPGQKLNGEDARLGAWAYPASKLANEHILESFAIPNPKIELVLAGVYSDYCELVPLYQTIERIRSATIEKYFYPGATGRGLTYVHIDDVVRACDRAIDVFSHPRPFASRNVYRYLIGQPEPVTYGFLHAQASIAFHSRRQILIRVPRWFAVLGACLLSFSAHVIRRRRFLQPWMIAFAEEHFEFDLRTVETELLWCNTHSLHDDLDGILQRAQTEVSTWYKLNEARPW